MKKSWLVFLGYSVLSLANPYPDPNQVAKESDFPKPTKVPLPKQKKLTGLPVLRFDIAFDKSNESYSISKIVKESSGTEGMVLRAPHKPVMGSYRGELLDPKTETAIAYDSVGTGQEYRLLVRAMTFRFPLPSQNVLFRMYAEDPKSGGEQLVLQELVMPTRVVEQDPPQEVETKLLLEAVQKPAVIVNLYSEGYKTSNKASFFSSADRVVASLKSNQWPGLERFEIRAVFSPSNQSTGSAENLGLPVPQRDSFLTLYYPYWDNFGRWYHVVYPTRESIFRDALASVPYDYPIAIVDNSDYWGVGNFNQLTAIPAGNGSFTYLLLHEFGHFFGLNEEYESGGKTELAFAPGIEEPWSQNITFHPGASELKWKALVAASTPLPTPSSSWMGNGPFGAYRGGYAETEPLGHSHKPGKNCIMSSGSKFCPICKKAIEDKVKFDVGITP